MTPTGPTPSNPEPAPLPGDDVAALARLNQVLVQLATCRPVAEGNLSQSLPRVAADVAQALQVSRVNIWFFDPQQQILTCREHYDARTAAHTNGAILCIERYPRYFAALTSNRTLVADDAARAEPFTELAEDYLARNQVGALIDAPIRLHGQTVGVLCVEHVGPPRQWTPGEQTFTASVGDLIALAMESAEHAEAQRKVRTAQQNLRFQAGLLDAVEQAVIATDTQGVVIFWNRHAQRLYGYSSAEAQGRSIAELILPPSLSAMAADIMAGLSRGGSWAGEITLRRRDGSTFPAWVTDSPIIGDDGQLIGIVGVSHDLSERKRAEEALRRSEERSRLIVEQMPALTWTTDLQMRFTSLDGAGLARYGQAVHQAAMGRSLQEVLTDPSQEVAVQAHRQALTGLTVAYDVMFAGRVYQSVVKPLRGGGGEIEGVLGLALDVTERHQAEADLRQAHAELESRVQQRTADLMAANRQLQQEITERRKIEEALASSEHRLLEIIDGSTAIIYVKDLEGRYILTNRQHQAQFGMSRQEVVGKHETEVFPPDIVAAFQANDQKVIATQAPIVVEEIAPHRDGPHTYVSVKFPLFDLDGHMFAVCGISTDISSRIQAEQALRESEEKYRVLVQHAPAVILNVSREGTVQFLSRRLGAIGPAEALGRSVLELVHADQRAALDAALAQVFRRCESVELEVASADEHDEEAWYEVRMGPIQRADGEVIGATLVATDVTDRRRTEQDLRMIRSAVENVQDAVVITNAEPDLPGPQILFVNAAFCRMTGYTPDQVVGRTPRILQGPRSDRTMLNAVRKALHEALPFRGEMINYRRDGSEFVVAWEMAPVFDANGRLTNWIATQRDVTQRRQQEEQSAIHRAELAHVARLSTMGEMASGLAHELNQPLAAIANYARGSLMRLRQEGGTSDRVLNAIEQIADQAERAGQIIRRMRNFIRKREPRRSTAQINELIHEAVAMTDVEARHAGVRVRKQLDSAVPLLLVDHIQIEQVVLNLLRNAIEAMQQTPPERRELLVSSRLHDRHVHVQVSDHGRGLGSNIHNVFDPFFTTKAEGMGMGLTISRSIVEAHGGRLWASDNPGGGSTFHFTLPLAERSA